MEKNKYKTEQEFVDVVAYTFSKHFKVNLEVWSKCKNARIDILLNYKDTYYFGVECKQPNSKRGEEIGDYVKQAIRYTKYEFEIEKAFGKPTTEGKNYVWREGDSLEIKAREGKISIEFDKGSTKLYEKVKKLGESISAVVGEK